MLFTDALKNATENTADDSSSQNEEAVASVATFSLDDEPVMYASSRDTWSKPSNYVEYKYYSEYSDSSLSTVDKNKNITLSNEQINLTQENHSQYIPFEIQRYYDGFDLINTKLSIYWANSANAGSEDKVCNVYYNDDKIRFGWLVDSDVTALAGKIKFEIHAEGTNSKGEHYLWKTRINDGLNVIQALEIQEFIVPDNSWQETFLGQVNEAKSAAMNAASEAQNIYNNLKDGLDDEVREAIGNNYYTKSEVDDAIAASDISGKLANYYTSSQTDQKIQSAISTSESNTSNTYATKTEVSNLESNVSTNYALKTDIPKKVSILENDAGYIKTSEVSQTYATKKYVEDAVAAVDVTEQLTNYYTKTETDEQISSAVSASESKASTKYALKTEIPTKVSALENDTGYLTDHQDLSDYATKNYVDDAIARVDVSEQLNNYYTKTEVDNKESALSSTITTNTSNISSLSNTLSELQSAMGEIDTSPRLTYDVEYNDPDNPDVGENVFVLYEIENEGKEGEVKSAKKKFTIVGGSGGGATSSTLKIEYITKTPLVATSNDKILIKYNFSGTDSSGDPVMEGAYTWKVGNTIIANGTAIAGENTFDITNFISLGTQKAVLSIVDDAGSLVTKAWTIQKIDIKLESSFNDKLTYPLGQVSFDYTPYGAVEKTIHFILDDVELSSVVSSSSGIPMSYTLPAQIHGAHLLEVYITAEINGNLVESNHILKDIIWYDDTSDVPVISCVQQTITAKQYDITNIVYTVYDPKTETPKVTLSVDDNVVSTLVLSSNTQTWQYKSSDIGEHVLTIQCKDVIKTIHLTVEKLDIDVEPVTANLAFDFSPTGKTNSDTDRLWTDGKTSMTVSDNFDWVNGGYQIDENGDQYFCIKAGTTATIDYNLFADDARKNGKEFKVIFKTANVSKSNTTFLTCMANDSTKIGLQMNVHEAYIRSSLKELYAPYSEEDIIEFEFNIEKDTDIPVVMTYEDGTPYRPMSYTSDHSFTQSSPVPIVIGSPDCDVYIYRMKAYSASLTSKAILSNFIADARNADAMIARYNQNQIYDENNNLTPESVAKAHPNLKVIKIDCPHFTNDKKDFVINTNIECIHTGGDAVYDNWKAVNCAHSGQGTTSNEYGAAGRNIDLLMCFDGIYTNKKIPYDENYKTILTLGDGTKYEDGTGKITLQRTSIPTNYLNVKVNIASSECENNAIMQKRYNDYLPYKMPAQKRDSRVKNSMEFVDCVIFIRENDSDLSTHREFQDTDWHFYAIGNVGDSKKTDYTRVNDVNDPKEFVVEIMDNTLPNSTFSGSEKALASLDADQFDEEGTYGFRYEMSGITDEQRQTNMQIWRDFYRFVSTSSDEEFVSKLQDWFIVDSALYFYLFTERYTMIDNRAKNTFWHYSKVYISQEEAELLGEESNYYTIDDEAAQINDGYRFELWAYDFDTCEGINNSGELTMTYGKEDVDYRTDGDPSSGYIFNAAESVFFCRIRDLMRDQLAAMYLQCESQGCWSSTSLISEFDSRQSNFSEELWRTDYVRKYERTYRDGNTRFLEQMMNGRKKYQRRQFDRDQDAYIATKYFGTSITSDQIMFRCNTPVGAVVSPDYTLHLTPYSDMYLSVMFGATYRKQIRAKAGQQYDITCPFTTMDDTAVLIYCASRIQSMGDVSACYIHDNDFSKATKLKVLIIGNATEGYSNGFLTKLVIGNNRLLEVLDIRNTPNLTESINLSGCNNLQEFYAEGSGITGVVFASGGKIKTAHIPAVTSFTAKNLNYIEDMNVEGFENLRTLIVENTPAIDTMSYVNSSPNLTHVRLIGIDWNATNTDILDRLIKIAGIDNSGYNTLVSVLTGEFYSPVVKQKLLSDYNEAWSDLAISYDTLIAQYSVTFKNDDGTILDVQYVDKGEKPVDPIKRQDNPIAIPTKESTVSTDFTFSNWDAEFTAVFSNQEYTATYTESTRKYTAQYVSRGTVLQETVAPYGSTVFYTGDTPSYTAEESAYIYYWFTGWDKFGYVNGDTIINAVYDRFEYSEGCFDGLDISEMRPVQIYAMTKVGKEQDVVQVKDNITFNMGNDFTFDNIEERALITEKTIFTGKNYVDTGLKLMETDSDWVLAMDYEWGQNNANNAVLAQCYQGDGSNGFKLWNSSSPKISWGTDSTASASINKRDMLVLRHIKGETTLHVYKGNLPQESIDYTSLSANRLATTNQTLVFGCSRADDGVYENHAIGTIYWAKVWFADLGDDACRNLVQWTHETISLEVTGFRKYYLSDGSGKRSSISFLASHTLCNSIPLSGSTSNAGGYENTSLKTFLNNRFYNAIPIEWKQLIKQVKILSSAGSKSKEIVTSNCYVTIPSVLELDTSYNYEPYSYEGETIPYMTSNSARTRRTLSGELRSYWTRSANADYNNYFFSVSGDEGNTGSIVGYEYSLAEKGIVILLSI